MLLLLTYLFLALFFSFCCSIMEAVLLSTPESFLLSQQQQGQRWAEGFSKLKADIDRPLSAILSLNTVAHTVGAAGVGAQSTRVFGEAYFGLVSAVLTLLILIVTEIIPKTIGARYWRRLAAISGRMIRITMAATWPLVLLSARITRLLGGAQREPVTSREEISALASIGTAEGLFDEQEHRVLQNLLRLRNVSAAAIMTPRVVMAVADEQLPLREFLGNKQFLHFSRIPVYSEHRENITGYVFRQQVFEAIAQGQRSPKTLADLRREVLILPASLPLFGAWETLLERREHLAVLVDEYGGVEGLVTMEDIVETLLGLEIVDETDAISDMQDYARQRWQLRQAKYQLLEQAMETDS